MDVNILLEEIMRTKQRLVVKTAFELFRRHGFQRVSVEEICFTAGVSKVTFYRYYTGKDDLILHIIRRLYEHVMNAAQQMLDSDLPIREKLNAIVASKRSLLQMIGDEMMRGMLHYPAVQEYTKEVNQLGWEMFREFYTREQAKGNINPRVRVETVALVLNEMNRLFSEDKLQGMFDNTEDMIEQINDLLYNGMIARGE